MNCQSCDTAASRSELERLLAEGLEVAAGGLDEKNAAEYARAGADVLVTSAPFTARPRDVQVRFARATHETGV
jgi:molybdenum transport protein